MALIGKIRNRSGLIVTFVGLGLLLFIIPVDKIWQQFMGFEQVGIGKFNGEDMFSYEPRNNPEGWRYNDYFDFQMMNRSNIGTPENPETAPLHFSTEDQIAQEVWSNIIMDSIYTLEFDILGIDVSKEELNNGILNPNKPVHSQIYYQSLDENGNFDLEKYTQILNNIKSSLNNPNAKNQLVSYEKGLKDSRKGFKYLQMMKLGAISTYQDAKRSYIEENTKASIKYVYKSYDDIEDSLGNHSSTDLKNYFNSKGKKEKIWNQDQEMRSYDYVLLKVPASKDDIDNVLNSLNSIKTAFAEETDDSIFVSKYSYDYEAIFRHPFNNQSIITDRARGGEYSKDAYKSGRFSREIDQQIENAEEGTVIGPFISPENQNFASLVKVYEAGKQDESKMRQILIPSPIENTEKKNLADSIYNAIRRDTSKFSTLAIKYSADNSTKSSGGIKSWFPINDSYLFQYNDMQTANVRHILIKSSSIDTITNQPVFLEDSAKFNLVDSIRNIVKADTSKFSEMVSKFSEDEGSVKNGGKYLSFPKGQMVPEFNDFSFNSPAGSIGVVRTQYGYHIIEVLDKNNPVRDFCFNGNKGNIKVIKSSRGYHVIEILGRRMGDYKKLAIVNKKIEPSEKTRKAYEANNAEKFQFSAEDNSFEVAAENEGLEIKSAEKLRLSYPFYNSNGQITNLGAYGPIELDRNNEIMEWAFNNDKVNSIMEPVLINSSEQYNNHNVEFRNTYVVAVLKEVIHEDDMSFNNIKPFMESVVKNKNKAKSISASLENVNSLEEASKSLNVAVQSFDNISYSHVNIKNDYNSLPEPKLMATIFSLKEGETSKIIEGKSGVYMIEVTSINAAEYPKDKEEVLLNKAVTNTKNLRSNIIEQKYQESLYDAYNVKDYRLKQKITPRQQENR